MERDDGDPLALGRMLDGGPQLLEFVAGENLRSNPNELAAKIDNLDQRYSGIILAEHPNELEPELLAAGLPEGALPARRPPLAIARSQSAATPAAPA